MNCFGFLLLASECIMPCLLEPDVAGIGIGLARHLVSLSLEANRLKRLRRFSCIAPVV